MRAPLNKTSKLVDKVSRPLTFLFFLLGLLGYSLIVKLAPWQQLFAYTALACLLLWRRFGKVPTVVSTGQWLLSVWALQLLAVILFIVWYAALQSLVPEVQAPTLGSLAHSATINWLFFPWSLYFVIAVALALVHFKFKQPLTFAAIAGMLLPRRWQAFRFVVDVMMRIASNFTLGMTVLVFAVALLNGVLFNAPIHLGLRGEFLILFVFLSAYPLSEKRLQKIQRRFMPDNALGGWLALLFAIVAASLLVVHVILFLLTYHDANSSRYLLQAYPLFDNKISAVCFYLIAWAWWFGLLRPITGCLVQLSQGRSIIAVFIAFSVLPLGLFLGLHYWPMLNEFSVRALAMHSSWLGFVVLMTALLSFIILTKYKALSFHIFCGEVDGSERQAMPRTITLSHFLQAQLQICVLCLAGLEIQYLFAALSLCAFLVSVLVVVAMPLWYWLRARTYEKPTTLC